MREFILDFVKKRHLPEKNLALIPLQGDGSKRTFWRIQLSVPRPTFIAMANPPADVTRKRENFSYLMIGKHLHAKGVPVPEIHRHDPAKGWFLMEDMGSASLQDLVSTGQDPIPTYEILLEQLIRLQIEGAKGFDTSWCYQTKRYDFTVMRRFEADYFVHAFLQLYLGLKKDWSELETAFSHLAKKAGEADNGFFMHRDFQSRNIMVSNGNIGIVDWQGGRLGPLGYDLASLLIDPYSALRSREKEAFFERYLLLLGRYDAALLDAFKRSYPYLAIQRNLQILGAFSHLTKIVKKSYFEKYIPRALRTLYELLFQVTDPELSALRQLVRDISSLRNSGI